VSTIATLVIRRGAPGEPAREESWDVPFEPGQSVLDALRWIRAQRDPTLAIRYSCTNANSCKECMVRIEGRTVYACIERLREGATRIAPLPNKALVRDLVTEIAPPDERLTGPSAPHRGRREWT
jgi:succinate dehydrogenase/fumarate reductase-like Fe-S protein